jgi:hypothetical protein
MTMLATGEQMKTVMIYSAFTITVPRYSLSEYVYGISRRKNIKVER